MENWKSRPIFRLATISAGRMRGGERRQEESADGSRLRRSGSFFKVKGLKS